MMLLGAALFQAEVAFSAPAMPAGRLLPELGKSVGLKMEAAPSLAREILLVQTKGRPLKEVMGRIAQATGGAWERKEEVYRLSLSPAADAKERLAEAVARGERLRGQFVRRARGGGVSSDPSHPVAPAEPVAPVLARLSAETLGGLGYKERVVFSPRPRPTQRAMPPGLLDGIDLSRLRIPGTVVLLSIQRTPVAGGFEGRLFAADPSGAVVAELPPRLRERGPGGERRRGAQADSLIDTWTLSPLPPLSLAREGVTRPTRLRPVVTIQTMSDPLDAY